MKINGIAAEWRFPEASGRELSRRINEAVRDLVVDMRAELKPMKFDATEEEINQSEQSLLSKAEELLAGIMSYLPAIAFTIYKFNAKQWLKIAKSAGGKKNAAVMLLTIVGATGAESWYNPQLKLWQAQTANSLHKLLANIITDFTDKIRFASAYGHSKAKVNEIANQRFEVYQSWGKNRAAGAVATWNSRLMRQRLKDAMVSHYFWRGVMDLREREKHVKWEGKRISLNSEHVFPGEEYNCRCWAVPDFSRIGD